MNKEKLEAFAKDITTGIKTEADLNDFRQVLNKITLEAALKAELEEHLGYRKHEPSDSDNARNGYSSKTITSRRLQPQAMAKTGALY